MKKVNGWDLLHYIIDVVAIDAFQVVGREAHCYDIGNNIWHIVKANTTCVRCCCYSYKTIIMLTFCIMYITHQNNISDILHKIKANSICVSALAMVTRKYWLWFTYCIMHHTVKQYVLHTPQSEGKHNISRVLLLWLQDNSLAYILHHTSHIKTVYLK